MIKLYNKNTKEFLGRINESQLQFLIDHLEEESVRDKDYFIRRDSLEALAAQNPPPGLIPLLQSAIRSDAHIEIRWEREPLPVSHSSEEKS